MITWTGEWPKDDRFEADEGLEDVAWALWELDIDDGFYRLFGDITLTANPYLQGKWHALIVNGQPHEIQFKPGLVTPELVIHELGHVVNDTVPNDERPATLLAKKPIVTASGKFVTGPGATDYSRHGGRYAPKNGYKKDVVPYHQHPVGLEDGNTPLEDWADMFLAWVTDNFTDDERGQALREFVENYLRGRLA